LSGDRGLNGTYRRVDAIEERGTDKGGFPEALPSLDSTQVLVGEDRGNASDDLEGSAAYLYWARRLGG
jgi:hypothetical protein